MKALPIPLFEAAGRALFGPAWKAALASTLDTDPARIGKILRGERPAREGYAQSLLDEIEKRQDELAIVAHQLRAWLDQPEPDAPLAAGIVKITEVTWEAVEASAGEPDIATQWLKRRADHVASVMRKEVCGWLDARRPAGSPHDRLDDAALAAVIEALAPPDRAAFDAATGVLYGRLTATG